MGTFDYYATVVRQVPPGELAKAAARRALGIARRALYRPGAVADGAVLEAFGAERPDALAERAFDAAAVEAWCRPSRRRSVREALEAIPGARARALARAEAARRREFDLFGVRVEFGPGGRTDWAADPSSGHRYPLAASQGLALSAEGADPKFPWALGRLEHLLALGQGYWAADEELARRAYARTAAAEIADFLGANPAGMGIQWANAMEVALRGANLAQALWMFSDAEEIREGELLRAALRSLSEHARFVEHHLEDGGVVPNNHLVGDHLGLFAIACLFPSLPGARRRLADAAAGLSADIVAQVHDDGVSFEGSIAYHRLATELFTLAFALGEAAGVDLGAGYSERLHRLYRFASAYCSERGLAPQLGDNDSARALGLSDRQSLDHGYLLPLGAVLFADAGLKREGVPLCDEAAWLFGAPAVDRYQRLAPSAPPSSFISARGGFAVLRGGGAVLTASVGPNGQRGVGGHSHDDKLSFELHVGGEPVISDPGSPSYSRDPAQRTAFRSTRAHNTPEIDRVEQSPIDPQRPFALPDRARAHVTLFSEAACVQRLSAVHGGYRALADPVDVERTWVLDAAHRALTITDVFRGRGAHRVVSRFHFPDAEARLRPATALERHRALSLPNAPRDVAAVAVEIGPEERPLAALLVEAGLQLELGPAPYSPGYGQVRTASCASVERALAPPARMVVVVLWETAEGPRCA